MEKQLRVLILEDNPHDAELAVRELCRSGFEPQWWRVETEQEYLAGLENRSVDLIIADYGLPQFSAERALRILQERQLEIPFILLSGAIGEETAVSLIKQGATDYLLKDRLARLGTSVAHALAEKQLRTEHNETIHALKENEARYRSLVEAMSQMVWTATNDGNTVAGSVGWKAYTGQKSEESNGWGWTEAVHPEDREQVLRIWEKARATGTVYEAEYRVRSKDGSYGYFHARGVPVFRDDGSVREWVGTCTNITERKQADLRMAAFSTLGQRLSAAYKPAQAADIIVEVADRLFGWDACTLHLYSEHDNRIYPLINVDLVDGKRRSVTPVYVGLPPTPRMQHVLTNGKQLILRTESDCQESQDSNSVLFGQPRLSASIMILPICHMARIVGILSIQSYQPNAYNMEDLEVLQTLADYCGGALERIRAEEQIVYQANLLANVNDAIVATDAQFLLTSWNRAAAEMYGWQAEEVLGRKLGEIILSERTPQQNEEILQRLQCEGRCHTEEKQFRRNGDAIYVEGTTIALRNETEEIAGYATVNRDVTKRRQLEEQLRQSQKMEAFGQLAGGVAHDFNNILTVIGGYTNLLMTDEHTAPQVKEDLSFIASATERATNLTRQLLTFSRKKEIQLSAINLNDIVSSITRMLQRIIGEDVRLQLKYGPNVPSIEADVSMLEQVLLNLAVNARDAMPSGGELFISTDVSRISGTNHHAEARPGEFVCLAVRDTGSGIPSDVQARIFEPFFTTKGGKGTGLGLAMVYGIVKQHHGWIEVSSQPTGTTFKVFLPAGITSATATTTRTKEVDVAGGTETILLVEDEDGVRCLARDILTRHGYRVVEAASGVDAIAMWETHRHEVELLLTDMVMPGGVNGRQLAANLLNDKPQLKVIYVSGYSMDLGDLQLREGWNFLQKPYQPRKLAKAIRDRLDSK